MEFWLKILILLTLLALGGVILLVLSRELLLDLKKRLIQKQKEKCLRHIIAFGLLAPETILQLTLDLKTRFPLPIVQNVLEEMNRNEKSQAVKRQLAEIIDHLGFVDGHLKKLREAKGWTERAQAAEILGEIGLARAVLPLLAALKDPNEDKEVKSVAIRALGKIQDERAISVLIESLGSLEEVAGQFIADTLVRFGEPVLSPLTAVLLSSRNEHQRFWSARILGLIGSIRGVSPLLNALGDHSARVRAEAAKSLGVLKTREAIAPLRKILLTDPATEVRSSAAAGFGLVAEEKDLVALQKALDDLDYSVRLKAMEALENMGPKAQPIFLSALVSESKEASIQAAHAMERMGIVSRWIEALEGEGWKESFDFLVLVAKAGVVETLIRSLKHPLLAVRVRLCRILESANHPRAFEALADLAGKDPEWLVRMEALRALVDLADPRSVPVFVRALNREEETLREELLRRLENATAVLINPLTDTIVPLLQDSNVKVRGAAIRILKKNQTGDLLPHFIAALSDAVPSVREESAMALGDYPPEKVIDSLIPLLKDGDRSVRIAAVRSLGKLRSPRAIEPLTKSFEQADEGYRDEISFALAHVPSEEFYKLADFLMGFDNPKARAGIAWTLGLIKDQRAVQLLTTFLKDKDPLVRASAAGALGQFGSKEVGKILIDNLADPSERVRAAAVNAIGKSGDPLLVPFLLKALENEPDSFVAERGILAAGSLLAEEEIAAVSFKEKTLEFVTAWYHKARTAEAKGVALIALAFLQSKIHFESLLETISDNAGRENLQNILKGLPSEKQKLFFDTLALDPRIFWFNRPQKIREYYVDLLQGSRLPTSRIRALEALRFFNDPKALALIGQSLAKDPEASVRSAALRILGEVLKGGALVAKLLEGVNDPAETVRLQVLPILDHLSPKELQSSRESLTRLLDSSSDVVREKAAKFLARLYRDDWNLLADVLMGTGKKNQLLGLIQILGQVADAKTAPFLLQFMRHGDPAVKKMASASAAKSQVLSKKEWFPFLEDPLETVRLGALQGIGAQLDSEAIDPLSKHLEDPSPLFRRGLAVLLGARKIAGDERPLQMLKRLAQDENTGVKVASMISLFRLGVTGQGEKMGEILGTLNRAEKQGILDSLHAEGIFVEWLTLLKQGRDPARRKEALCWLGLLDLQNFTQEILLSLQDPSPEVRLQAMEMLAAVSDPLVEQALANLASDPNEAVRKAFKRRRLREVK